VDYNTLPKKQWLPTGCVQSVHSVVICVSEINTLIHKYMVDSMVNPLLTFPEAGYEIPMDQDFEEEQVQLENNAVFV